LHPYGELNIKKQNQNGGRKRLPKVEGINKSMVDASYLLPTVIEQPYYKQY